MVVADVFTLGLLPPLLFREQFNKSPDMVRTVFASLDMPFFLIQVWRMQDEICQSKGSFDPERWLVFLLIRYLLFHVGYRPVQHVQPFARQHSLDATDFSRSSIPNPPNISEPCEKEEEVCEYDQRPWSHL